MERKEKLCQPPEYPAEMFAEYFERAKERALRISEIEAILGDDYDLDRLRDLVEADRDGRVKIHPNPEKKTCGSDVREKLVELLDIIIQPGQKTLGDIADYLIAHGVTVQELALPEEEYYVLRNTETGMYFRGKGVNRWGKHFNQATIYRVKGTAEHSIKEVAWRGEKAELVRIKIAEIPQPPKGE